MDDEQIDCTVVFGADNVNHLCGYWRYFGGPSALVIGRDGMRTLSVMLDEAPIAEKLSEADHVLGYGERGFGIDLDPVARLVETLAAVPTVAGANRIGVASELPTADTRLGEALSAVVVDAGRALYGIRLIKDWDSSRRSTPGIRSAGSGRTSSQAVPCPRRDRRPGLREHASSDLRCCARR